MAEETKTELEEMIEKTVKNAQGDLSEEVKTMKEEMKEMKNSQSVRIPEQRRLTEKEAAEEFIEHFDSCDDGNCGIHNMKDDTKKQGFMKGFMLGKKLQEKKE